MDIFLDIIFTLLMLTIGVVFVTLIILIVSETKFYKKLTENPGCQTRGGYPVGKNSRPIKSDAKRLSRSEQICAAPWD
jgi:hypothetical protein